MRCNRKELAALVGVDVKTIDSMVRKGMPYLRRPEGNSRSWEFETGAVVRWMIGDDLGDRMKEARSRLREAKAGLKWLEYGRRLGHLVDIDDLMPPIEEAFQVLKSRLLAMPDRLAHIVAAESDPAVIERIFQREIDDMFEQLDKQLKDGLDVVTRE